MLENLTERFVPTPKRQTRVMTAEGSGTSITIRLGDDSFMVRSGFAGDLAHGVYDFALFGAAAVALRHNYRIVTDLPVTQSAVSAVRDFADILDMWAARRCYPIKIECSNIVPAPSYADANPGVICLSGGIDSTFAALEMAREGRISHGLLMAGADYPSSDHPGFRELFERVTAISRRIGIENFILESDLRRQKTNWSISHVLALGMAMAFHSSAFRTGFLAADFTLAQEFAYHPWGNTRPLVEAMGSSWFPVLRAGESIGRTRKLGAIHAAAPELLRDISVCYSDQQSGGNCGACEKCIRTKLNMAAADIDFERYFNANPPLADQIRKLKSPTGQSALRRHLVFLKDVQSELPGGPLRTALDARIARLQRRVIPLGKR